MHTNMITIVSSIDSAVKNPHSFISHNILMLEPDGLCEKIISDLKQTHANLDSFIDIANKAV